MSPHDKLAIAVIVWAISVVSIGFLACVYHIGDIVAGTFTCDKHNKLMEILLAVFAYINLRR